MADTGIAWSTSVDSTRKLTSPTGSVTIPCEYNLAGGRDLVTYDTSGQIIRRIPYTQVIDGVENCIDDPVVDKNDVLYGVPFGKRRYSGTGYAYGANLLAYKGSTLLWKYPVNLTNGDKRVAVGANGNVYTRVHTGDGDHLVGLVPTLSAGATQPRKVLDVKLPFGDSATYKMSAYRDGLILHTGFAPNMKTHFFSYGGAYLGESPVHPMDEVFNAEGKLFIPSLVNYQYNYGSTLAYPRLIAGTSAKIPPLASRGFRACSGAVTENITDATQWNEGTQLDLWPDTSTKVVTLTIGGNDIGFSSFGEECFWRSCDTRTAIYTSTVNKINNELPTKLETTYKRILKYAPNAKVYVIGYPHVIANKQTSDGANLRCPYMQDGDSNWGDARAARSIVAKLNAKISTIVLKVRSQSSGNLRLRYVPADGDNSPFKSHEICGSGASWFQNANQGVFNPPYAFHPNKSGQEYGYKVIAQETINAG